MNASKPIVDRTQDEQRQHWAQYLIALGAVLTRVHVRMDAIFEIDTIFNESVARELATLNGLSKTDATLIAQWGPQEMKRVSLNGILLSLGN